MLNRTLYLIAGALLIATPAQPQKQVKDQREAELFNSVAAEKDPLTKLSLLNQWANTYPETDFRQERNLHYVSSYTNLEARAIAVNAPSDMIREGEKAVHIVLDRSDELFAPDLAPGGVKPEDWAIARQEALRQAHSVLAALASKRKDYTQAEAEFGKLLEMAPDDAAATYRLGVAIVGQRQAARYPAAIFYLARAVGLLPDSDKTVAQQYLDKVYSSYHGDLTGLGEIVQLASQSRAQPADWHVVSAAELAVEFAGKHPEIILWRGLKESLTGADGAAWFDTNLKGAEIPGLKGKLVSQPGAKELLIAVEGAEAELRLKLDVPIPGLSLGITIEFAGVAETFTPKPLLLTLRTSSKAIRLESPDRPASGLPAPR